MVVVRVRVILVKKKIKSQTRKKIYGTSVKHKTLDGECEDSANGIPTPGRFITPACRAIFCNPNPYESPNHSFMSK